MRANSWVIAVRVNIPPWWNSLLWGLYSLCCVWPSKPGWMSSRCLYMIPSGTAGSGPKKCSPIHNLYTKGARWKVKTTWMHSPLQMLYYSLKLMNGSVSLNPASSQWDLMKAPSFPGLVFGCQPEIIEIYYLGFTMLSGFMRYFFFFQGRNQVNMP